MFSQFAPVATLPMADLSKARSFYEGTLGLTFQREGVGGVTYAAGIGTLFLYESEYAGTNKATAVTFELPTSAFDVEVDALRTQGVSFITFEMDGLRWDDGVASMGSMKSVWFADPDGNIINAVTAES